MRMGMMRIPCRDLAESENYYTNIFGLMKIFGCVRDGYIGYALDNIDIMIEPEEKGEFESGCFLGFSLVVKDINKFYKSYLAKGIKFTGPPEKQSWGGIMTHVIDCSGNSFSIVQEATEDC